MEYIQIHEDSSFKNKYIYPNPKPDQWKNLLDLELIIFTPVTVTTKRQVPVFPASSVDEQFTVVSPIRYVSWDEWEQITSRWKSLSLVAVEFSRTVDDELSPSSVVKIYLGSSHTAFIHHIKEQISSRENNSFFDNNFFSHDSKC